MNQSRSRSKEIANVDDAVRRAAMQFNRASAVETLRWQSEREHVKAVIAKSRDLKKAIPQTVYQSILQAASMGLSLNPMTQHCYLIPRKTKRDDPQSPIICYPSPSYRGLSKICIEGSGNAIVQVRAEVVFQADKFKYLGPIEKPKHEPVITATHRKQEHVIGAYAIAEWGNGSFSTEFVDITTLETIRSMSEMPHSLMYTKFFTEGYKKIAIRRLTKTIQVSSVRLDVATSVLNQHEGIAVDTDSRHRDDIIDGESTRVDEPEAGDVPDPITVDMATELRDLCQEHKLRPERFCESYGIQTIDELPLHQYESARERIIAFGQRATS